MKPSDMSEDAFVGMFGGAYENSPWVAHGAYAIGLNEDHDTAEPMCELMSKVVEAASRDTRLELLRAHPDLAGKLAQRGELTDASTLEQAGAGLDECTAQEFQRFTDLNEIYKTKFGFPYILAVAGFHRIQILENFEQRVLNDVETEFMQAITQVHRIASLRIHSLLS